MMCLRCIVIPAKALLFHARVVLSAEWKARMLIAVSTNAVQMNVTSDALFIVYRAKRVRTGISINLEFRLCPAPIGS